MPAVNVSADAVYEQYRHICRNASGKTFNKWRSYLAAIPQSRRPFNSEDLDQWALEALLVVAGVFDNGYTSLYGRLNEYIEEGGERYLQRVIDMFTARQASRAVETARAVKRCDVNAACVEADGKLSPEMYAHVQHGIHADNASSLGDLKQRYPVLYCTEIEGLPGYAAQEKLGLTLHWYRKQRRKEINDLASIAVKTNRVKGQGSKCL